MRENCCLGSACLVWGWGRLQWRGVPRVHVLLFCFGEGGVLLGCLFYTAECCLQVHVPSTDMGRHGWSWEGHGVQSLLLLCGA